jgi:hypothetical protein
MAKTPSNHGKVWSPTEVALLRDLAAKNTPTRVMGIKLHRTPEAVRDKASDKGISLRPWNQRPYGTQRHTNP